MSQNTPTIEELHEQIKEKDALIAHLERRGRIDELLRESDAVDLEAARLLTELAVEQMDQPDVEAAVADLKRRKPLLFNGRQRRASAMAPRADAAAPEQDAAAVAAQAGSTGSRADLLRYLRLRRSG